MIVRSWLFGVIGIFLLVALCVYVAGYTFVPQGGQESQYGQLQKFWTERIAQVGSAAAYKEFISAEQTFSAQDGHLLSHLFGELLYKEIGIKGLALCTKYFNYGCYHQFIGTFIQEGGLAQIERLQLICNKKGLDGDCLHSIGHGIVGFVGYAPESLSRALALCEPLGALSDRSCVDGVFMEYNRRFLLSSTEKNVSRSLAEGVLSPCQTVDQAFKEACAFALPYWWLSVLPDPEDVQKESMVFAANCVGLLDMRMQHSCFEGVGYVATFRNNLDEYKAKHVCVGLPNGVESCLAGVDRRLRQDTFKSEE